MDGTVLIADDDRTIRTVLTQALTRAGCRVHATSSLTTLMRWISEGKGDAVITDVMMPDGNGLEMLPKITQDRPDLPVIVISAQNTIMTAIRANEAEAFDYLPKPFDLPDLLKRTARALGRRRTVPGARRESAPQDPPEDLPLVGHTPVMQALYGLIARLLNAELPVVVVGESGSGKSLIVKILHDFSDRRTLPFVTVGPADMSEVDGPARILARARGGTVVLDEICDFDDVAQARVVRMMDAPGGEQPRFVATSQRDLSRADAGAALRPDLFYRLDGAAVTVPSLRERVEDIPLLVTHFLDRAGRDDSTEFRLAPEAVDLLRGYSWPGNVRQLAHMIQRLRLTARPPEITRADVESALAGQPQAREVLHPQSDDESLSAAVHRHMKRYFDLHGALLPPPGLHQRILREIEQPLIEITLDATGGNQLKCADLLGVNRNTLRKKIKDLGIRVTRSRKMM